MRIAVRLPGEVITFVDSEVSQIRIPSRRAAVVLRASNASDAAILTATEPITTSTHSPDRPQS